MAQPNPKTIGLMLGVPVVLIVLIVVASLFRKPPAPRGNVATPEGGKPGEFQRWSDDDKPSPEELRQLNDPKARAALFRRLGEKKDKRFVKFICPYCNDPIPEVRVAAIWACGEIGDPLSVSFVMQKTGDEDPAVRAEVATALSKLYEQAPNDERVVNGLLMSMKDPEVKVRLEAAKGLAKAKDERGIKVLVDMMSDKDEAVRKAAEERLKEVGEAMVPKLSEKLYHGAINEEYLRAVKLLSLYGQRPDIVAPFLKALMASSGVPRGNPQALAVREICLNVLSGFGDRILPTLDEEFIQARVKAPYKEAAAELLKRMGPPAVAPISRRIISRDMFTEKIELKIWVDTLGDIGDPAAAPALASALAKRETYKEAVEAAIKKIEAKTGKKLELPPPPPKPEEKTAN